MDKKDQAAVVLAGGSSRRMGYDKAFIKLEGVEMLKRIVNLVYSITSEVIVVIDKEANPDIRGQLFIRSSSSQGLCVEAGRIK